MAAIIGRPDGVILIVVMVVCAGGLIMIGLVGWMQRRDFARRTQAPDAWIAAGYGIPPAAVDRALAAPPAYPDEPDPRTPSEPATAAASKTAAPRRKPTTTKTTSKKARPKKTAARRTTTGKAAARSSGSSR